MLANLVTRECGLRSRSRLVLTIDIGQRPPRY
jgi:hypothetical protein